MTTAPAATIESGPIVTRGMTIAPCPTKQLSRISIAPTESSFLSKRALSIRTTPSCPNNVQSDNVTLLPIRTNAGSVILQPRFISTSRPIACKPPQRAIYCAHSTPPGLQNRLYSDRPRPVTVAIYAKTRLTRKIIFQPQKLHTHNPDNYNNKFSEKFYPTRSENINYTISAQHSDQPLSAHIPHDSFHKNCQRNELPYPTAKRQYTHATCPF